MSSIKIHQFGFRSIAIGPRIYEYDYDIFGIRLGLDGSFELGGNTYNWSAGTQINDAQYDSQLKNFVDLGNLALAVGDSFRDPVSWHINLWNSRSSYWSMCTI